MPFLIPDDPDFFLNNKGGGMGSGPPPRGGPGAPPAGLPGGFGGAGGGGAFYTAGQQGQLGFDPFNEIRRKFAMGGRLSPEMLAALMQLFQQGGGR